MNILIRADSSSTIGTGHIMRDLVLAKQFENSKIIFAVQDLAGNINYKITEAGYNLEILKSANIGELEALVKEKNIDMLVIDHYDIDFEFEKRLKQQNPALKIFVLDDTYEKHHCDILLNHNIYAKKSKYKELVPSSCEVRCGSKQTLLRDEFHKEKAKAIPKTKSKNIKIFIAMGGADTQNLNPKILKILKNFEHVKAVVVTTSANKNLEDLKEYAKEKKWIKLYINSEKIAKLMRKSDFGIITPSVSANEAYFMKLPFIAIKTADNQNYMHKFLKKNGFGVMGRFSKKKLNSMVKEMIKK
ncbi:UDP-2,4-diacetamido-2,4,6-trideoxy-beta-L-altropyranose hydrolase [Sulfurimonas sp.]|uniref:UDP-2,4-diacetamido-2,4, 6-trideoxy-beta-L-altropyranose hydrolase n=1 Tax=Sulfurimonas sp. TaxID=2022749 RepID=UPI0025D7E7A7|nr:UDP-2,4-diacetamido-2,4,6-trideoxy-beta-L-altropyranose hydrolase [Sulfurimonas sp.]